MKRLKGLRAMLLLMALLTLAPPSEAKTINVYARLFTTVYDEKTQTSTNQPATGFKIYFDSYYWDNEEGESGGNVYTAHGDKSGTDARTEPTTTTLTMADNTTTDWTSCSIDIDDSKAGLSQWYKCRIYVYDSNDNLVWKTGELNDIQDLSQDLYIEIGYMPSATSGDKKTWPAFIYHEENKWQALGYDFDYFLMDSNGKRVKAFAKVKNQEDVYIVGNDATTISDDAATEIQGHTWSTTLFNCSLPSDSLTSVSNGFYIQGFYLKDNTWTADGDNYIFRPNDEFDFASGDKWDKDGKDAGTWYDRDENGEEIKDAAHTHHYDIPGYWATYGKCRNSSSTNLFKITPSTADNGYEVLLNASYFAERYYETNQNNDSKYGKDISNQPNNNHSGWGIVEYDKNSVSVQRAPKFTPDADGYNLLINMVRLRPEDGFENQESATGSWDLTDTSRAMKKVDAESTIMTKLKEDKFADDDDVVYRLRVDRPQSRFEDLFFDFCPASLQNSYKKDGKISTDINTEENWNKILRPVVQGGKTTTALSGLLFTPMHNNWEAITPNLASSKYTQFDIFLNATKGTYLISPVDIYNLTGPALSIWNTSDHQWHKGSADMWGNGQFQYNSMDMAYDPQEDCWVYTGQFYKSVNRGEDGSVVGTDNGFRFRTNRLYTINYHEEPYWFSSQNPGERKENIPTHQNLTYDKYVEDNTGDKATAIETTRPAIIGSDGKAVEEWTNADGSHNPNGPDSYYYNHVVKCETGTPDWANAKNYSPTGKTEDGEEQQRLNINFDLPDGIYTIKFYPQGDETGKPYYTLEESKKPGTEIPEDITTKKYKYIRTYSAPKAYKRPEGMDVYVATQVKDGNILLKNINSLGYLPANTGLIIAYVADISTKGKLTGLEFTGSSSQQQFQEIASAYPTLSMAVYDGPSTTDYLWGENNLLVPTTTTSGTITSIPTTEFFEGKENEQVKYRNYNFTLTKKWKKNPDGTYVLDEEGNKVVGSAHLYFRRIKQITQTEYPSLSVDSIAKLNTPTAERAYLRLTGSMSGGETYGTYVNRWGESLDETLQAQSKFYQMGLSFGDDATTTGISEVTPKAENTDKQLSGKTFTLTGIEVGGNRLPQGIYIRNGKKFIVK